MITIEEEKRCNHCILPTSFKGAMFNADGICSFCSAYQPRRPLGVEKLRNILTSSNNSPYDCVVLLSGGKDSTYVLYYAVKELGLNVVGVNYDSGFQSDLAIKNMQRSCKILHVPLIFHRSDFVLRKKIIRRLFQISDAIGGPIGFCANCANGIIAAGKVAARMYGVNVVLSGQTDFERFAHNPVTGKKYLTKKFCHGHIKKIFPIILHTGFLIGRERIQLNLPVWQKSANLNIRRDLKFASPVKIVHFFDYIPWACMHPKIIDLLTEKLDWEYPGTRIDRFDCMLHPFLNYKWLSESGVSWDGYLYSESVRDGGMTREEALKREKGIVHVLKKQCLEVLKRNEFNDIKLSWLAT